MLVLAGVPIANSYYAGLILVFIYIYTFSGLRFIWALGTSWCIVIIFEILTVFFTDIPGFILVSNNFFFITSNILSMFAAYFIEYSLRRDYYLARLLEIEKGKVNHANNRLERLVKDRTTELRETNEELNGELIEKRKLLVKQEELQEQLVQSQKMEAIGHLAGGVAHDFNNLLTIINGYSELLLMNTQEKDVSFKRLQQINEAGKRAERLTRQLLAFSRKQILQPVIIDLNRLLKELDKMLRRLIGENIKLVFKYEPELYKIKADPGQLEQVILNLIVNARDAMSMGGEIFIETQNIVKEKYELQNPKNLNAGSKVLLTIADTGVGMDDETINQIFDPFFTTKEKEKGTGLGLSTVYGIIKQSDASIHVKSQKGKGTKFSIYFNTFEANYEEVIEKNTKYPNLSGRETILIVEDEKAVREYLGIILNKYGYNVILTYDGNSALKEFKKNADRIDLLVTDIIMPGMSGKQMLDKMQKQKPDLKYIYISGYSDDIIGQHGILDEKINILQKPFTHSAFLEKIRSILD